MGGESRHTRSLKRSTEVKASVTPYADDFVSRLSEVAQYIYDKHGKFPGTFSTIALPGSRWRRPVSPVVTARHSFRAANVSH